MIQIRKVRVFRPRGEEEKSFDHPLQPDVCAPSVSELFKELDKYLGYVKPEERWNLYYTIGTTGGGKERTWAGQHVMPFDIDGIKIDAEGNFDPRYVSLALDALEVDPAKTAVVCSGNGLQIIIAIMNPIVEVGFFKAHKLHYKLALNKIAAAYEGQGLVAKMDDSSFAPNRIFRLPGTENRKPGKPSRQARLVQGNLEPQSFDLVKLAGLPPVKETEQVTDKQMKRFAVDVPSVESGCNFLKWCKTNPALVTEPLWYSLLSIVGRLKGPQEVEEDARRRVHEYSKGHPGYRESETDRKLDHALAASGPRSCENINQSWGNCDGCPNFQKVTSPICIKGDTFIATEGSGFYMLGKGNNLLPQYEDLRRYLNREHPYKVHRKSSQVYIHDGKRYADWSMTELRNFADKHFDPKPKESNAAEFVSWVNRTNLVDNDWFKSTTMGKINFANGVLDTATGEMGPHSADLGFLYCLPFDYDKRAKATHFKKFLHEVTLGDVELQDVLLEFVGYAICDQEYWLQKALLLVGEGSNGKSTFLKVVEALAGRENVGFLSLSELQQETSRSQLQGKIVNISDELPSYNFRNTEMFKKLLGGSMTARRLYQDSMMIENTTKFIFSCNDIPASNDTSHGLFRRLSIVPFNATFNIGENADTGILNKMLPELPGIFNLVFAKYSALKARGTLAPSVKSDKELTLYKESVDRIGAWVRESLAWNGKWDDSVPALDMNTAYERYFSDSKRCEEKPVTKFHFTRHLRRHIDHWDDRYTRKRLKNGELDRHYVVKGVWFQDGKTDAHGGARF